jgi:hypothetical protein
MDNIISQETQMRLLFDVYYKECPERKIEYTAQEYNQSWIVMSGIELSYMLYKGEYQPIFMCGRYCEGYGDDVYYFKSYSECEKVWLMNESELKIYIDSLIDRW